MAIPIRQKMMHMLYNYLFSGIAFETVLDVGSGNGKMVDYFFSKGKKCQGVDLYPARADIQKVDILHNDIPRESFDLVYSAHVIEHLPDSEKFVKELLRISKRYVCVMAPLPGKRFWDQPDHLRPYTAETLKRVFHLDGWVRAHEINLPFFEPVAIILFDKKDSRIAGKTE